METFKLGEFTIDIVDDPAQSLGAKEKEILIRESIPVARKAYRNDDVTESDIIIHAIDVSTGVYIKDAGGTLIGFSTCVPELVAGRTILHLKATAISAEYQGQGIYAILSTLRVLREAEKHDASMLLLGTRTQSPLVFRHMVKRFGLYPQMHEPIPDDLKLIAEAYAALVREKHSSFQSKKGLEFDRETFIVARAYGAINENGDESGFSMYGGRLPLLKDDKEINEFIERNLNINNGDAFLLLGQYSQSNCFSVLCDAVYKMNPYKLSLIDRFRKGIPHLV